MASTRVTMSAAEVIGMILANQQIPENTVKLGTEILAVDGCATPIPLRATFVLQVERRPLPRLEK